MCQINIPLLPASQVLILREGILASPDPYSLVAITLNWYSIHGYRSVTSAFSILPSTVVGAERVTEATPSQMWAKHSTALSVCCLGSLDHCSVEQVGPLLLEHSTYRCWRSSSHLHTVPSSAWFERCSREWGCYGLLPYSTIASPMCLRFPPPGAHQGALAHLDYGGRK